MILYVTIIKTSCCSNNDHADPTAGFGNSTDPNGNQASNPVDDDHVHEHMIFIVRFANMFRWFFGSNYLTSLCTITAICICFFVDSK